MAKKYLKNSKGIVKAITTNSLQLEKPLLNENYDIEVHNRNMDKLDTTIQGLKGRVDNIDTTIQGLKGRVDNIDITIQDLGDRIDNVGNIVEELELKAEKVSIADSSNLFNATNVEEALLENKNSILANQELINRLNTEVNGQRLRGISIANAIIDKLEG